MKQGGFLLTSHVKTSDNARAQKQNKKDPPLDRRHPCEHRRHSQYSGQAAAQERPERHPRREGAAGQYPSFPAGWQRGAQGRDLRPPGHHGRRAGHRGEHPIHQTAARTLVPPVQGRDPRQAPAHPGARSPGAPQSPQRRKTGHHPGAGILPEKSLPCGAKSRRRKCPVAQQGGFHPGIGTENQLLRERDGPEPAGERF